MDTLFVQEKYQQLVRGKTREKSRKEIIRISDEINIFFPSSPAVKGKKKQAPDSTNNVNQM